MILEDTLKKLDMKQKNNLLVGNNLAAEVPASCEDVRAFVSIGSYVPNPVGGSRPSKILNPLDQKSLHFWIRKYEVPKDYIQNMWDVSANDLINSFHRKGILSLEDLEIELGHYLDDFSQLGLTYDNPL